MHGVATSVLTEILAGGAVMESLVTMREVGLGEVERLAQSHMARAGEN